MSQNPGPGYGQTPPPDPRYGYPPQQSGTQPYGQSPQPAQPYGQPQQSGTQPYGQSPQPAQPYAYPAQQAPTQPYGQPVQGYAPTPMDAYGATAAHVKRSPILGLIAVALVVVCGIVLSLYAWRLGSVLGNYVSGGALAVDPSNQAEVSAAIASQIGAGFSTLGNLSGIVGFVAWILGIVATVTKRGRGFGVAAIILGVLAPIVAFVLLVAVLAPYMS